MNELQNIDGRLAGDLVEVRDGICIDCERCTWNPGPDCGVHDHLHCKICGHCIGRHKEQDNDRFVP